MRLHCAVLISIALMLAGCSRGPESTVEQFYRSIEKGQIAEARSLLSRRFDEQIRAAGEQGEEAFISVLVSEQNKYRTCGGIDSVKANLAGEGETRSGITTVTFRKSGLSGCEALNPEDILIKEDGAWKILK